MTTASEAPAEPPASPIVQVTAPETPLRNALQGLAATDQNLALLDYANILIRRDYKQMNTVKIASGGCPGLELNYTGFVGKGLLTVAILGEAAVAPCSRLILRVIRDLLAFNNDGVLIITQANSESFNFGLACQRALEECLRIKHIVVDDNRSFYRNSCGFLLIGKMAGALAELQCPFHEISKACEKAAKQTVSVTLHNYGAATAAAAAPMDIKKTKPTMDSNNYYYPEYHVEDIISMDNLSLKFLEQSTRVVVLINVSKVLDRTEEFILVKRVLDRFKVLGIAVVRIYAGRFMLTPKEDAMLTVMNVDSDKVLEYLDAPSTATGWNPACQTLLPALTTDNIVTCRTGKIGRMPEPELKGPRLDDRATTVLERSVQFAMDALVSCEHQINLVDAEKSRGNLGTRIRRACEHMNKRLLLKKIATQHPYNFCKVTAAILENGIGGTMGSIYGVAFEAAADSFVRLDAAESVSALTWLDVFKASLDSLANHFNMDNEFTTMLHPLLTCEDVTKFEFNRGTPLFAALGKGVYAAEQAALQTKPVGAQYSDAGAHVVGIWLRAVYEACKLTCGLEEKANLEQMDVV